MHASAEKIAQECWNCHQYSRGDLKGDASTEADPTLKLGEGKGEAAKIVADKVGMSHGTFDKARTIWEKAKEGMRSTERRQRRPPWPYSGKSPRQLHKDTPVPVL